MEDFEEADPGSPAPMDISTDQQNNEDAFMEAMDQPAGNGQHADEEFHDAKEDIANSEWYPDADTYYWHLTLVQVAGKQVLVDSGTGEP